MIHERLLEELDRIARRYRRLYLWRALSLSWLTAGVVGAGLFAFARTAGWTPPWTVPLLAGFALLATCTSIVFAFRSARDHRFIARLIEA